MDRKRFLTATGLLGVGSMFSSSLLFGQAKQKGKPMAEKIMLKDEGQKLIIGGDHQQFKFTGKDTDGQYLSIYQDINRLVI